MDLTRVEDVRAASRSALVSRHADIASFESAFDLFWSLLRGGGLPSNERTGTVHGGGADGIVAPLGPLPRGVAPAGRATTREAFADEAVAPGAGKSCGRIRRTVPGLSACQLP